VIDWGPGPGGMQARRGHRSNILDPGFRLAGIGAVLWPRSVEFAVTQDFGATNRRMLGGVVFNDLNRSRFYDLGKGVGNVAISTGIAQTKSWRSGAYAIALPESKAKLTVELKGEKYVCSLPDGKENVKFDVIVSDLSIFNPADKLLAAVKKIPEANKNVRFAALVDLYLATRDVLVEERALGEITSLVGQVREDLEKDMATARRAVSDDAPEQSTKEVQAVARKYSRTKAQPWFTDAMTCAAMNVTYLRLKALREGDKPIPATPLNRAIKDQQKKFAKLSVPEWRKAGVDLMRKTAAMGVRDAADTKPGSL